MAKKQGATYRAEMACVHLLAWEAALIVAVEAVLTRREDDKILGGLREYEDVNECVNRISRAESVIALAMLFTDSGMDIRLKKDDRVEHYSGSTRSSLRREYCQWAPQLNGGSNGLSAENSQMKEFRQGLRNFFIITVLTRRNTSTTPAKLGILLKL